LEPGIHRCQAPLRLNQERLHKQIKPAIHPQDQQRRCPSEWKKGQSSEKREDVELHEEWHSGDILDCRLALKQ
jgi:hypothetical protein